MVGLLVSATVIALGFIVITFVIRVLTMMIVLLVQLLGFIP